MRLKSRALASPMDSSSSIVLMAESDNNWRPSSTTQGKSWKPCFNFDKGTCRFGDSCRYVHDANARVGFPDSQHTWHQRLDHPGSEVLRHLVSNKVISCNKEKPPILCHAYQLGKHVRLLFVSPSTSVTSCFDIIHSDVWTSPISSLSSLPKSYRDAFSDPNWQNVMRDEYHALIKNKTWTLVPRPPNTNIVRCMWLFRQKYLADGTLSRYKARLVANGSTQLEGVDVDETFSPVVKLASSKSLLQHIIRSLHQEFAMTDLGSLNYFLGISVIRDSSGLFLSQKKYAIEVFDRVHMDNDLVAYSNADWVGCPTTWRSTFVFFLETIYSLGPLGVIRRFLVPVQRLSIVVFDMYGYCKNHMKRAKKTRQKQTREHKEYTRAKYLSSLSQQKSTMSALNSKLLSINLNSQRLDKEKQEVKNIVEQATKCRTSFTKSLFFLKVIHKEAALIPLNKTPQISLVNAITHDLPTEEPEYSLSMGDEHLSTVLETELDEVIKSSVENLVPIPSESEVTSDNESECDVPVNDESSPIFTTFSNPLFDCNDDFTSSDDKSLSNEDVPMENFKIYSNPLFDDEEIISTKIDLHYFNVESNLIKSLLNRDTLIHSSPKFDYLLEEFSSELAHIDPIPPGIEEADFDLEEEIRLEIDLFLASDDSMLPGIENDDYDSEGDIRFLEELLSNDSPPLPENKSSKLDHFNDPSSSRPPPKPSDVEVCFDIKPDKGVVTNKVVGDISKHDVLMPNVLPT
ncbi:reverse transcriptase domain-containing protein [Tanacetum coccineum]